MSAAAAPPDRETGLGLHGGAAVVLRFALGLHAHGQGTTHTIRAAEALARRLGIDGVVLVGWDRVELLTRREGRSAAVDVLQAAPTGVNMRRVAALMREASVLAPGHGSFEQARLRLGAASRLPGTSPALLAAAAALGACALATIFGDTRPGDLALLAGAGALGGLVRGFLAARRHGVPLQDAAAALIAGLVAGLAQRLGWAGDLRLLALCPCMILIPGPHLMNGVIDLLLDRVALGWSRLLFAGTALMAISAALTLGLGLGGESLPVTGAPAAVPAWRDILAGGVAAACYGTFYAMPPSVLVFPAVAGMLAHGVHWAAQSSLGWGAAPAAALASAVAGAALSPVAQRFHLPFAGLGFAATVSMLPGIFLFPMGSAVLDIARQGASSSPALVAGALGDGATALLVLVGMTIGLVGPEALFDAWRHGVASPGSTSTPQET